jgi:hypothetical protein
MSTHSLIHLFRGVLIFIPLFEGVAVTLFVTDGVVAFDLPLNWIFNLLKAN